MKNVFVISINFIIEMIHICCSYCTRLRCTLRCRVLSIIIYLTSIKYLFLLVVICLRFFKGGVGIQGYIKTGVEVKKIDKKKWNL